MSASVNISNVSLSDVVAFLEFLVWNGVSVNMVANNVSAIKANLVMYGLEHTFIDYRKI